MIGLARGFVTTFGHMIRPAITERYPDVVRQLPERSRSSFALVKDDSGTPDCKSCGICAKDCPDDAIQVEGERPAEGGARQLTRFSIDLGRCMFCGICVEKCPQGALVSTGDFELATTQRGGTILVLWDEPPRAAETPTEGSSEPADESAAEESA